MQREPLFAGNLGGLNPTFHQNAHHLIHLALGQRGVNLGLAGGEHQDERKDKGAPQDGGNAGQHGGSLPLQQAVQRLRGFTGQLGCHIHHQRELDKLGLKFHHPIVIKRVIHRRGLRDAVHFAVKDAANLA